MNLPQLPMSVAQQAPGSQSKYKRLQDIMPHRDEFPQDTRNATKSRWRSVPVQSSDLTSCSQSTWTVSQMFGPM